jgi:SurA N-terminal domain
LWKSFGLILFTILLLTGCGTAQTQNRAVDIKALEDYLTEEKIDRRIYALELRESMQSTDKEKVRANAIKLIIDEYIVMNEAKNQGFSVSDKEVQKVIEFSIETASKVQNVDFKNHLDELGLTTEEYYRDYAYESIKEKLLENKLYDEVTADTDTPDQEVEKWNEFKKELIKDFRKKNDSYIKKLLDKIN